MIARIMSQNFILVLLTSLIWVASKAVNKDIPLIFPIPSQVSMIDGKCLLDSSTYILISEKPSQADAFLADLLRNDVIDRFGRSIKIVTASRIPESGTSIAIGTMAHPLVRKHCEQHGLIAGLKELGAEGYLLSVSGKQVIVAANGARGAFYGVQSLRQIIKNEERTLFIPHLLIKDSPQYPFRGIKLYVPGSNSIPFFKRFIKDFVALYKFNKVILELNANMRLDRHPELNIGAVAFADHLKYSRLGRPPGPHKEYQNSSHQDNADGGILEKEEVADIVKYMRKFHIEVIPEFPSLTHSYYLLPGHRDLAENPNQEYPDTYCPLKPEIYKIYFDVLDEYIDVIHPSMIHIGHDEWRMEKEVCPLCRGKDYNELYAKDLNKIHDYLTKKKGIQVALWGDHLLESVYGKDFQIWKTSTGYEYKIPASLRPDQVKSLIPKDILVFNWFWSDINNDKQVSAFGFRQVYGNLRPEIKEWNARRAIKGVSGGAPSSWAGTTERNVGKDQLYDFLVSANLLWSRHFVRADSLALALEPLIGDIRKTFSGTFLPSDKGCTVSPLDISSHFNSPLNAGVDSVASAGLISGSLRSGNIRYEISPPSQHGQRGIVVVSQHDQSPQDVQGLAINDDVSSILFLHACAKEAVNRKAYDMIFNFDETAELLGWYEIVYEDGFVETIPVRYGVNILDWSWRQRMANNEKEKAKYSQNKYAYAAIAVECSRDPHSPVTFFSFEWENPRFGKTIRSINLHPVKCAKGSENAIVLLALSVSEGKRTTEAKGKEAQ